MRKTFAPLALLVSALSAPALAQPLDPLEALGKSLFFNTDLSFNRNMSCASCHDPSYGFASPSETANAHGGVVEGSIKGRFGNRRPPSAAYAGQAPVFHHQMEDGEVLFRGGAFLDGRASGHALGDVAADQAMGPFLNPLEMALPHPACVVQRACESGAAGMAEVWGGEICEIDFPADLARSCETQGATIGIEDEQAAAKIEAAYHAIARAIAAYEVSPEVSRFSSRFDRWRAGAAELSAQERAGFALFTGKGKCSACHVLDPGPHAEKALFTDYTYDNLGVPRNPELPFYEQPANPEGAGWRDPGLAGFLAADPVYDILAPGALGKQKVPTLRNVDARPRPDAPRAYMHNGYFKTLEGVVHFYNTRDVLPGCETDLTEAEALAANCWPAPEIAENVNHDELGDLGLSAQEEAALVAFLKTLTDE